MKKIAYFITNKVIFPLRNAGQWWDGFKKTVSVINLCANEMNWFLELIRTNVVQPTEVLCLCRDYLKDLTNFIVCHVQGLSRVGQ